MAVSSAGALRDIWALGALPVAALARAALPGNDCILPSSFCVGVAAQTTIAAAALAAAEVWRVRTGRTQSVEVDVNDAAIECTGYFSLDGRVPDPWDEISGLYPCGGAVAAPGFVRIHANFAHHRAGALNLLGLDGGAATGKSEVITALQSWSPLRFEDEAATAGLVVAALRSFAEWDRHPQSAAIAAAPLVSIEKCGEAPPHALTPLAARQRPLEAIRVLDLTRILAGPVAGRTLAAYGADVMLVNSPDLPNIAAIADTSRGKLSAHLNLANPEGRAALVALARDAHVFMQGYRPGAVAALGFAPEDLAVIRPGIVCVSLSAYGETGPWARRRGFDSLVQTATGFNQAEGDAFGAGQPRPLPVQILDYASGFLMAFGAQAALLRQAREGGAWRVGVSLARTAQWLAGLGRIAATTVAPARAEIAARAQAYPSGFGALMALPHAAKFSATPPAWSRPSSPPGTDLPLWPAAR